MTKGKPKETMIKMTYARYLERLDLATQNALEVAAKVCEDRVVAGYRYGNREAKQCAAAIRAKKVK
jgi:hypothetical protein